MKTIALALVLSALVPRIGSAQEKPPGERTKVVASRSQGGRVPGAAPTRSSERARQSLELLKQIDGNLSKVAHLGAVADRTRDPFKMDCVQHRVQASKVIMRLAFEAKQALVESTARQDDGESDFQIERLRMLADKLRSTHQEARVCLEEQLSTVQSTIVKVEVSPAVPDDDPSQTSPAPRIVVERPPRF